MKKLILISIALTTLACPSCPRNGVNEGIVPTLENIERECMRMKTKLERHRCCSYYGLGKSCG